MADEHTNDGRDVCKTDVCRGEVVRLGEDEGGRAVEDVEPDQARTVGEAAPGHDGEGQQDKWFPGHGEEPVGLVKGAAVDEAQLFQERLFLPLRRCGEIVDRLFLGGFWA